MPQVFKTLSLLTTSTESRLHLAIYKQSKLRTATRRRRHAPAAGAAPSTWRSPRADVAAARARAPSPGHAGLYSLTTRQTNTYTQDG